MHHICDLPGMMTFCLWLLFMVCIIPTTSHFLASDWLSNLPQLPINWLPIWRVPSSWESPLVMFSNVLLNSCHFLATNFWQTTYRTDPSNLVDTFIMGHCWFDKLFWSHPYSPVSWPLICQAIPALSQVNHIILTSNVVIPCLFPWLPHLNNIFRFSETR